MSFIVHAAERMLKLPSAKSASIFMSGSCPAGAAKLMLQVHGRNKSHVPGKIKKYTITFNQHETDTFIDNIVHDPQMTAFTDSSCGKTPSLPAPGYNQRVGTVLGRVCRYVANAELWICFKKRPNCFYCPTRSWR